MTKVTKTCERDGCYAQFNYGIETRITPKWCSFECQRKARGDL